MNTNFKMHNSSSSVIINNEYVYLALRFVNPIMQTSCQIVTCIKRIAKKALLSMKSTMDIFRIMLDWLSHKLL